MEIGRINHLGQIVPTFPIVPVAVTGVAGMGLVIGAVVVKGTPGTVMGILGGVSLAGSLIVAVVNLVGAPARAGAPGAPLPGAAPPPPPPPPPKPASQPSYAKYLEYAKEYAPVVNQLFSALFGAKGFARQPAMLVAHGRGR